jgi:hypothetical protein
MRMVSYLTTPASTATTLDLLTSADPKRKCYVKKELSQLVRTTKETLSKRLRGNRLLRLQSQSRLFTLPLEIRFEIYTFVFASSMIHEPTKEPLSTWDRLLLSCRQVKMEMESLPVHPIITMVHAHWKEHFSPHVLRISGSISNGRMIDMKVNLPRGVFQEEFEGKILTYLPTYISPLFRIYTDSLTLGIYNDGSPSIASVLNKVTLDEFYVQLQSIIWSREHSNLVRSFICPSVTPPPSRNFLNTKKFLFSWTDAIDDNIVISSTTVLGLLKIFEVLMKPIRMRIGLSERKMVGERVSKKYFAYHTFVWESETRFRR